MKRELSRISRQSTTASALEAGESAQDEFNLDDFLTNLKDEQQSAGHLPKNLGLIWRDLTVKVWNLFLTLFFFSVF
jgi:hypothetical protein